MGPVKLPDGDEIATLVGWLVILVLALAFVVVTACIYAVFQ